MHITAYSKTPSDNMQPGSCCEIQLAANRARAEVIKSHGQPRALGQVGGQSKGLHLHVVLDTSAKSVALSVEVVNHALPLGVWATGGTGLQPGIVLGPCSHVAQLCIQCIQLCIQPSLPMNVFGLPDHNFYMGVGTQAPLQHHVA